MQRLKTALTIKHLPHLVAFVAADKAPYQVPTIRFNMDSFSIGVNTFALITMRNHPDKFENLTLKKEGPKVEGIQGGLVIKGTGSFNFHIEDDEGAVHHIKIPNSKYIPSLKICLLLPRQYPFPRGTRIEDNDEALLLIWNQGRHKRIIPHSPMTNTPTFRMALALHTYHAFMAHCKTAEAQYYRQELFLQVSSQL
jgi:hypothetical protein